MKNPLLTERAMGLVAVLSGLAIPIAMVIGAGDDFGADWRLHCRDWPFCFALGNDR